jgi:hypothetical protein
MHQWVEQTNTSFTIKLLAFLKCFFAARFLTAFRKKSKTVHDQTLFSSAFLQRFFAARFFTASIMNTSMAFLQRFFKALFCSIDREHPMVLAAIVSFFKSIIGYNL